MVVRRVLVCGALGVSVAIAFVSTGVASSSSARSPSIVAAIAAFKKAGIPVTKVVIYTQATDPNHLQGRPGQYTANGSWSDARVASTGLFYGTTVGMLELFSSSADLQTRERYVKTVEKGVPSLEQYIYADGLALLRVSFALTPAQAAKYQSVLARLEG